MLNFTDTNRSFKLEGDLLKTMTNYKVKVGHSNPPDRKIFYEFAEKINFDIGNIGRPSTRDKSMMKLLKSPAMKDSGISTIFLSPDPNELCDRLNF